MLGHSTRTFIVHTLGCDTSSALFYYRVWFLSLHESIPWHLCWIWMSTSSGGPITQPPLHTIIYNGCVCLQPSIRINTCWGRAEDSLVSLRTQDPASTSPNQLFILEQHSMWKTRRSSGSRPRWPRFHLLSMWKIKQFKKQILIATTIRYGWGWSTANCNLNPFS